MHNLKCKIFIFHVISPKKSSFSLGIVLDEEMSFYFRIIIVVQLYDQLHNPIINTGMKEIGSLWWNGRKRFLYMNLFQSVIK